MTTPISILLRLADNNALTVDAFARVLNAAKVKNSRPRDKPLKIADGGGLALYIPPTGAKTWRYRFRLAGKEQTLTLGGYPEVSLEYARMAHRAARWLVERGESPLSYVQRKIEALLAEKQAAEFGTFGAVAEKWLDATKTTLAARTITHRKAMIHKYVLPELKDKQICEITRKTLSVLLGKIDQTTPETAKHCRIYIKQIFDYALDHELVQGNTRQQFARTRD